MSSVNGAWKPETMMQFATIEQTDRRKGRGERGKGEGEEEEGSGGRAAANVRLALGGGDESGRARTSLDKSPTRSAREMRAPHQINHSQLIHFCL